MTYKTHPVLTDTVIPVNLVITTLLDKVPADLRGSFTPEQLLALKVALGGRNRRTLSDRERKVQRLGVAVFLTAFLLVSTAVGLVVLYLVKSALGIDLLPGFSLGVWGWFQEEVLR